MICASCDIEGQVQIGAETVLQPQCRVKSTRSEGVNIGERNVVEELCVLSNSNIEHGNVIQVGTVVEDSQVNDPRPILMFWSSDHLRFVALRSAASPQSARNVASRAGV